VFYFFVYSDYNAPFDLFGGPEVEAERGDGELGRTVESKGIAFTPTRAYIDPDLGKGETSGTFVAVELDLDNRGEKSAVVQEEDFTLEGGNGKRYEPVPFLELGLGLGLEDLINTFERLGPGLTKHVVTVFNVPEPAARGSKLVVGQERVELGLR